MKIWFFFVLLIVLSLSTTAFAENKALSVMTMKAFIEGNYIHVRATLKINGITIRENGSLSGLKIFDQNNPFLDVYDSMPSMVQDVMSFPLKEGKNTVEVEFYNTYSPEQSPFTISLKPVGYEKPAFVFSSTEKSGKAVGEFFLYDEQSGDYQTSVLTLSKD